DSVGCVHVVARSNRTASIGRFLPLCSPRTYRLSRTRHAARGDPRGCGASVTQRLLFLALALVPLVVACGPTAAPAPPTPTRALPPTPASSASQVSGGLTNVPKPAVSPAAAPSASPATSSVASP